MRNSHQNKDEYKDNVGSNKLDAWGKNNLASDAGKSLYDNWAKPVTEMSYSPANLKK